MGSKSQAFNSEGREGNSQGDSYAFTDLGVADLGGAGDRAPGRVPSQEHAEGRKNGDDV